MIFIIVISILSLLLVYLASKGVLKNGLELAFSIIILVSCIRYDYGNDYMAYFERFKSVVNYDYSISEILFGKDFDKEKGWYILCKLFSPFGFFTLVAFISIVQNVIYYNFIKKEVAKKHWYLAMFIYLFNNSFFLVQLSMMRQALAISLFVFAWTYIKKKKLIPSLVLIYLATTIHQSAMILYPFILWAFIPKMCKYKYLAYIYIIIFLLLMTNSELLNDIFVGVMSIDDFEGYMVYEGGNKITKYGLGFVLNLLPLIISLYYLKNGHEENKKLIVSLSCIGALIIPFGEIIQLLGRVAYYFNIFSIVVVPITYFSINHKYIRNLLLFIFVFMNLYNYVLFFSSPIWINKYSTFHTIFEVL